MPSVGAFPADDLDLARPHQIAESPLLASATRQRSVGPWLLMWGVAVPLGLLDGLHWYLQFTPARWRLVVLHVLTAWILYPAMVPLVRVLVRRFPLDVPGWHRSIVVHILAALAFQYVHLQALHSFVMNVLHPLFCQKCQARFYFPGLPPQLLKEYPIDLLAYWMIVGFFYASQYYFKSHEREVAAAKLETTLAEARLESLRRQLSPHFLFNTLNTISVLALRGDNRAVAETLTRLSGLLRVAIDETHPETVPLSDELKFLDGYLGIQQIRFADRLTIRVDVADESLRANVPFMILQPLVENAIEHGMSTENVTSVVDIKASVHRSTLRLLVSDSGPGFTRAHRRARSNGIGLINTESRLRHLYGDAHAIEYGHSPGGGASIAISIPFQECGVSG